MDPSSSTSNTKEAEEDLSALDYNNSSVKRARLNSTLAALLDDPILSDVSKNPSLSDVDTLINLELGSAMRISVVKLDRTAFDVAVMNSATVKDLKLGIKKKVNEMEESKMGHRHISWEKRLQKEYGLLPRVSFDVAETQVLTPPRGGFSMARRKHVWGNFCLSCHNEKLLDDNAVLQEYGIRNNSQVHFTPFVMARAFKKHSRRRKHRFFHGLHRKS